MWTYNISDTTNRKLKMLAIEHGITRSELVIAVLESYIASAARKPVPPAGERRI